MRKFTQENGIDFILVLNVSRWGRFQDLDLSAYYTGVCRNYGKQVIYTTIGFPKEDDLLHFLHLDIERYRAASYVRDLSREVFKGCAEVAQQGFWAGGLPPYGLGRQLLDEQRRPVQMLARGQRKSIQNQRVVLTAGEEHEVAVVNRIFSAFVKERRLPGDIAASLNAEGIPSPRAGDMRKGQHIRSKWTASSILSILTNELYIGTMIYNKTQQRLQAPTTPNPREQWICRENAFEGIVDKKLFLQGQELIAQRKAQHEQQHSPEDMLAKLARLHKRYGKIGPGQISASKDMVSAAAYVNRFDSLDLAYQRLFSDVLGRAKQSVLEKFRAQARQVVEFDDYYVLNESFSVLVQPSVPICYGYDAYWAFRPDPRVDVDITLGVPLSNGGQYDIIGYLAFPRMLVDSRNIKVFSSTDGQLELFGHRNLELISSLLD